MNGKDLRIGNLAKDNRTGQLLKCIGTSCEIDGSDVNSYFMVIDRTKYPLPDGWKAEPIPLSEDLLVKLGFKKVRYEKYAHYVLNKLRAYPHVFKKDKGFGVYLMGSYTFPHIKHVHQLQNLYFDLCGEELKIEA